MRVAAEHAWYLLYLLWLVAGACDFLCHRATDLPQTSGKAESAAHLVQLALLGIAIVVAMSFRVGPALTMVLAVLVVTHALVGYIDSRIAFARRRVVLPIEQHLHSVLDCAPVIALAWLLASTWPAAIDANARIALRTPPLPLSTWAAVLVPAALLCVIPALLEFRAAMAASVRAGSPPRPFQ